jgi:crotonobetainyl-CoA:carnitine CoA-transferase CaiB-like acyl-CoA transferase
LPIDADKKSNDTGSGALLGVRVLDLTHVLAGPFCSYQLALLGADVIKIEPVNVPDCARGRGSSDELNADGMGLTYQVQGGNKRALALDLSDPRGRDIFLKLVKDTDVLLENYTSGAMTSLGLGYSDISKHNPSVVYCSITGYGAPGPSTELGAYDNVIQAASGTIAQSNGQKPGLSFVDYATGYAAAFAISAALVQRQRTGHGTEISVSMLETAMSLMSPEAAAIQHSGGNARPKEAGILSYETLDGILMVGAFTPAQHRKLGECLKMEGFVLDELIRCENWETVWSLSSEIVPKLKAIFFQRTADQWIPILRDSDLPAERVSTLPEAVEHPQLLARGFYTPSPDDPSVTVPLAPFGMSSGGAKLERGPPRHGQDNAAILGQLGYTPNQIKMLKRKGITT